VRQLLLLSALAYGLLLLGLATLNGGLLALAIPLTVFLGAALLYGPGELHLRASRTFSAPSVFENVPVTVKLSVTNEGPRVEKILIADMIPTSLELVDGGPRVLASLPAGEAIELEYTVRGKRGCHEYRGAQATASEFLGIFQRKALLSAPGQIMVMPEVLKLRRVAIRPLRTRAYAGPVPARQGGSGVEFFGVREYQSGDPLRWINWRLGARHPHTLFTNEFEQERIADVGLILDARQRTDIRSRSDSLFEYSVRATASLAGTFLSDGNRVGLLVYGGSLQWTFPGYGKVQRERILQALAQAQMGESLVFDSLEYLPTRFFPAKSQLVLISPLCWDDLHMLVRLRALGYQVLVISPDPVSFEAQALKGHPGVALAARMAYLERTLLLRKLQQAGIQSVDWRVDRPFDQVVHASLGRVPLWYRAVGVET